MSMPRPRLRTVETHILEMQRLHPSASGEFTSLLSDITLAAKIISREVNQAGLVDILGATGETNVQGEQVQKLDELANRTLKRCLGTRGQVCVLASEEDPEPTFITDTGGGSGRYLVVFDPLDGSSNIDANVSVGTIFSIYRRRNPLNKVCLDDVLQPGRNLAAAGYVIYGSSTMFVYTTGQGVHGFTLDPSIGEFLLSHPSIQTPFEASIYSANESYEPFWSEPVKAVLKGLKYGRDGRGAGQISARYIGSLVADFHRNLLYGGVFLYPGTERAPRGKLRLMYEAAPLAMIAEHAGGYASDGRGPILDLVPETLHQRTPLFVGSRGSVMWIEKMLAEGGGHGGV